MAKKPSNLDEIVKRIAEIIEAHFGAIPAAQAKEMRSEIHRLAAKSSRPAKPSLPAKRKKSSKSPQSANPRRKSPASAKAL